MGRVQARGAVADVGLVGGGGHEPQLCRQLTQPVSYRSSWQPVHPEPVVLPIPGSHLKGPDVRRRQGGSNLPPRQRRGPSRNTPLETWCRCQGKSAGFPAGFPDFCWKTRVFSAIGGSWRGGEWSVAVPGTAMRLYLGSARLVRGSALVLGGPYVQSSNRASPLKSSCFNARITSLDGMPK
jgi:hypothetical protein